MRHEDGLAIPSARFATGAPLQASGLGASRFSDSECRVCASGLSALKIAFAIIDPMCGRFTLTVSARVLSDLFDVDDVPDLDPRYNIAPTQTVPVVRRPGDGRRELALVRWGLIPFWAKDEAIGARMINARGETVAEKPAFRDSLARRRCLVLADGFYEWKAQGRKKLPTYFHRKDGAAFAFAGLWASWGQGDEALETVTIVTAPANELVAAVHDRMPVIVAPADYRRWLAERPIEGAAIEDVLVHPDYRDFESFAVAPLVNSVANDGPELIARAPAQTGLF